MTARGAGLALGATGLALWGWRANWPELVGLGTGSLCLVLIAVLLAARRPRLRMGLDKASVSVVRGQSAGVSISIDGDGPRRWARVVEGPVTAPRRSARLPAGRRADGKALRMPLDTSRRGQWQLGPYAVVHGDPWGVVRRVVATAEGGTLTVRPRAHRLRRSLTAAFESGEAEAASRRSGDQHFHALRDYVLGDEPRTVHWRSTARAGKLVVRQQVSAASTGTTIVLDVDSSAYVSGSRFGSNWDEPKFEAAVEVAASLAVSQLSRTEQVHLMTTAKGARVTSASVGAANALLDALAVVRPLPPMETTPEELPAAVRRTRAARTVVVTSTPGHRMIAALRRLAFNGRLTVVCLDALGAEDLPGARVLRVESAEELVSA